MATRHVVVDGSNIATEGRSTPSLAQLDEGVRAYMSENPDDEIIVVVDASFGYRIDESERKVFEEAEDAGEVVSPPAGAIGRGDGFLLRIADRVDATVLSNDSFQEFHGEYKWLFDEGRLIGGKPVPGVGWIFTPRSPVRGPKSRMATRDAEKAAGGARRRGRSKPASEPVVEAIAEATAEVISPPARRAPASADTAAVAADGELEAARTGGRSRRRPRGKPGPGPGTVNEPLPFITFIAEHHLGTEVEGVVEEFTSHGAFVTAGGARCYVPLVSLADPPPRSAKEILSRGESRTFVVQALDAPRRGIELALPGLARVSGAPTEETVEAEIDAGAPVAFQPGEPPPPSPAKKAVRTRKAAPVKAAPVEATPVKGGRTPAQKALAKKALADKAAAKKGAPSAVAAPAKEAAQAKAGPKKAGAPKKAPAKAAAPATKAGSTKKAVPKKPAPAKKAAPKKAPAKKDAPNKDAAKKDAPKKDAPKKASPAKKAPAAKKTAKKVPVKKR
jgi:hypothetical protein